MRVDKAKIMKFTRRPTPLGAGNIGVWDQILEFITYVGIFTNVGIIAFTSATKSTGEEAFVVFIVLVIVFLAIRSFIADFIPDAPDGIRTVLKRHQFIVDKYLKGYVISKGDDFDMPEKSNYKIKFAGSSQTKRLVSPDGKFYGKEMESPVPLNNDMSPDNDNTYQNLVGLVEGGHTNRTINEAVTEEDMNTT
jgi:hypothetical protein